jgi:hypothetical protein
MLAAKCPIYVSQVRTPNLSYYEPNTSGTWLFVAGQNTLEEAYTRYVRDLARYYRRSPELISYEEVTDWVTI